MKYILKKIAKVTVSLALVVAVLGGTTIKVNAAVTASKKINDTYGKITGETEGSSSAWGKYFLSSATTTKKVPRVQADLEVQYYSTGKTIDTDYSGWKSNSKKAYAELDMAHFKNQQNNNKKDGFLNTKCTAYGCAEAIVKKAYTVYTSCVY